MRLWIDGIFLSMAIALISGYANDASQGDIQKVVSCMRAHNCKRLLTSKTFGAREGEQIVFVSAGKRYTFYWTGDLDDTGNPLPNSQQFFSVWVRPNGTHGKKYIETFTDDGLDGRVDFGIMSTGKKFFNSGADGSKSIGQEFQSYWQREYNRAIAAAIKHLL